MKLEEIFRLEPHGLDVVVGAGPKYPWGGLYGGQIVVCIFSLPLKQWMRSWLCTRCAPTSFDEGTKTSLFDMRSTGFGMGDHLPLVGWLLDKRWARP